MKKWMGAFLLLSLACANTAFAQCDSIPAKIVTEEKKAGIQQTDASQRPVFVPLRGFLAPAPLYVINGLPFNDSIAALILNDSGFLDKIEAIDVLKDEKATAIYGSCGAAGVIILHLKKKYRKSFAREYATRNISFYPQKQQTQFSQPCRTVLGRKKE